MQYHVDNNWFEEWKRFNDIKIREILQVKELQIEPVEAIEKMHNSEDLYSLRNFTYFKQSQKTICTGFLISTIDGMISIPVIGMKHIRVKTAIKKELINYIPTFKLKHKKKYYLLLLHYTDLPIEIIQYIMKFY